MNSVLYPCCAAISLLALFYKLRVLRTDRSPAQLALAANFFFHVVLFAISTPVVWVAISRAAGIVNLSGLLSQSSVVLSAASQQLVLLHLSHERRTAWRKAVPRLAGLTLILVLMAVLFSAATSLKEQPDHFAANGAQFYPAYLGVYLIGYAVNQIDVGILGWKYAKVVPTPWLRRGLIMIALNIPPSMLYAACRIADIIAGVTGHSGATWEPLAPFAVTVGVFIQTIGWTVPDWGPYLSRMWLRIDHRYALRQLRPLHREITAAAPEVILDLEPGSTVRSRLYRLVVEIRDAQWALRMWMDPSITESANQHARAADLEGAALGATVEAAQLKAALHAKSLGQEPPEFTASPLTAEPQDLATELSFQRQLARAFDKSPVVRAVLAQHVPRPLPAKDLA